MGRSMRHCWASEHKRMCGPVSLRAASAAIQMHALPFRSQVAGFSAAYEEGLVYATVRGAGHLVPQTQPERALELLTRFLDGEEI